MPLDRRAFLLRSGVAASGLMLAGPFGALAARRSKRDRLAEAVTSPYGPLAPVADAATGLPLLRLPAGFRYVSFGWTGDPLVGGAPTPARHDGMGVFRTGPHRVRLVRNHEIDSLVPFAASLYDPNAGGGTTTLEFDTRSGQPGASHASLTGTLRNCAGGATPWRSWLSCEETLASAGSGPGLDHGYVFEVPSTRAATGVPLRAMGRFFREAVAVDPATGIVYQTEDREAAGLYRFLPDRPGRLEAGGRLQMLAIVGQPGADLRGGQDLTPRPVAWVDVPVPDPADPVGSGCYVQGLAAGGATFRRLEGAFFRNGTLYFVSTSGGAAGMGQVWQYRPSSERLRLVLESPDQATLDHPDNVCQSPRGGLLLCEDGSAPQFLEGLSAAGVLFPFAMNDVVLGGERNGIFGDFRWSELAGACFDPRGKWLFFNIQSPGITFAVTGPWGTGGL